MAGTSNAPDTDELRFCNWKGSIPVVLTLAPTSLGTTLMPQPIHQMLNRGTYLHVGLRTAIQRLHNFAPATMMLSSGPIIRSEPEPKGSDDAEDPPGTNKDETANKSSAKGADTTKTPVCWFEDEETQIPLRWQLFAGILFDMMSKNPSTVPWRIRLHFSNYPSSQLLPLEPDQVAPTIERSFNNSLKQALFLQYGNSKVAMNISKQTHQRLWDSIQTSNYKLYQQINADLQVLPSSNTGIQLIPIRLFVDSNPPIQRPCTGKKGKCQNRILIRLLRKLLTTSPFQTKTRTARKRLWDRCC